MSERGLPQPSGRDAGSADDRGSSLSSGASARLVGERGMSQSPGGGAGPRSERDAPDSRLLVATRNAGKLRELEPMLRAAGFEPVGLHEAGILEDAAEDGLEVAETFAGNALLKARWFHERSGLPTLADDSGLAVRALGGEPGVRSKRFSGRADLRGRELDAANNDMLLERLGGEQDRRAAFVCAAAVVWGGVELVGEGRVEGVIVEARDGGHGFGYDPHFQSDELGVTFAEAERTEKERVSHRGRAVRALLAQMREAGWRVGGGSQGQVIGGGEG
ncbi:MAG TPA: non-canonical purine NTP pyrophosphatase [Gemmatimonadales bacterium]|nr:non-canonical purine NTP pyrophosphatase [Gemmatimonadales bacterium]